MRPSAGLPTAPVTASVCLRYCAMPRLSYPVRTTHPLELLEASNRFDGMVQACSHYISNTTASPASPVQLQLPLSKGGMGLRSVALHSFASYFASFAAVLPDFLSAFLTLLSSSAAPLWFTNSIFADR